MDSLLTRTAQRSSRRSIARAQAVDRTRSILALLSVFLLLAMAYSAIAHGQSSSTTYEPQVGQAGKDVVWVPTPQSVVDQMLDLAKVTPSDYLIDLGSGDGRTVITAAKRGLTAHGIEYNQQMVELAQRNAKAAGVADKATFAQADLFQSDFSKAQVITMFLLPWINEKLRPTLLEMPPGTRLVSNTFTMGDWEPDQTATVTNDCTNYCKALLWIVPAKVAGTWQVGEAELKLTQTYQMLSGTLGPTEITEGRMRGNEISFKVGNVAYAGTLEGGNTIKGTVNGGKEASWTATKK